LNKRFANSSDVHDLREKVKLAYRMAAHDGKQVLVLGVCGRPLRNPKFLTDLHLGAMGCGVYGCPPQHVAEEMRAILFDEEFAGWFKEVISAVYPAGRTGMRNYDIFKEVFGALES